MKIIMRSFALASVLLFNQACVEDDDLIKVQNHDDNEMMAIMHDMMANMMAMEMTNDPDNNFAMMMRIHHQGAIDMSKKVLQNGDDDQMKEMAEMIISAQLAEIQQLSNFLSTHAAHGDVPQFKMESMVGMERSAKNADLQIINGDSDHDFAMLMIGHHQSAIDNSRLELIYGHEPAMKTLAKEIIAAQEKEIKELQEWLLSDGK
ncbi:uncharacterized protein (DUF305 family) [Algoriphagus ratkowskyi]|uniref:DUF305 domain-containing protein n=1 Tax=Algoriphagus ratkowskyi TaxID=57028 RepID=A0A2W7REY9_9BACT|nr:DUF305 domain-containing protein [Algoriphagus ratkowskyi]PZX57686.1 uncharacterized protein (DUF305 family) [Algoriphagus ratkowskyi]TXD78956.1 DUF305 domain-containing protein [Algoriphagus ratkowskyi]